MRVRSTDRETLPTPPGTARVVLWLTFVAVAIRLLYLAEHVTSVFFTVPVLDEIYYDARARALAAGEASVLDTGFRPPLYPLVLAACYRLGDLLGHGMDVLVASVVQHGLGVATVFLVAVTAARVSGRAAVGACAGALYAIAGPPLYFEGERLITALFTFLVTAVSAMGVPLVGARERSIGRWLALGAVIGLATQARANALVLLALPIAVVALAHRGHRRRATLHALAAAAGTFALTLTFALWQRPTADDALRLMPSAGGVNLYLGNKRGADGLVPRQDRAVTYGEAYRDSVEVFAVEGYREAMAARGVADAHPSPRAVSRYWVGRTLGEISAAPRDWLALTMRKTRALLWRVEIPNNKSYAFVVAHESSLLGTSPVRWWLLLGLAPIGVLALWRDGDRPALGWLLGTLFLLAATIVMFFVNARFRIPLWPGMAILAGAGLWTLVRHLADRRWSALARALVLGCATAALSCLGPGFDPPGFERDHFFRSYAALARGDLPLALADARASLALDDQDAAVHLQHGNVLRALERHGQALEAYRAALRLRPDEPRVHNNLGVTFESLDRPAEALGAYRRAVALEPDYAPAHVNAALLAMRAGGAEEARDHLRAAASTGFTSFSMRFAEASVKRASGDEPGYRRAIQRLRDEAPDLTAQLLAEQARPLPAEILGPADISRP